MGCFAMHTCNVKIAALAVGFALVVGGPASAATIDYIFTGTADGTLAGTAFSGAFQVELVSDTSSVTFIGGEYNNNATAATFTIGASTGALLGTDNRVTLNPGFIAGTVIFGQDQPSAPFFVGEGMSASGLASYGLASVFPLTVGTTISQTPGSLYLTSLGDLIFSNITAMSFEADVVGATPLPAALPLFASGLGALGLLGWRRKRKNAAALAA